MRAKVLKAVPLPNLVLELKVVAHGLSVPLDEVSSPPDSGGLNRELEPE